ncbi:MAG: phosphate ABC transporter permease PstA [Ignavibacteriales bacterium]|nr:phosphate ABC transporter permease PstA [Ignavibacteriales bacterium]
MKQKTKWLGYLLFGVTGLCTLLIVAALIYMLAEITVRGGHFFTWEFLTANPEQGMTAGGIFPAIVGTVLLVLLMSIVGVPIGTITAIYMVEYAKNDFIFMKLVRFAVNTLAGVPSIVFGLFGLGFFIQFIGSGIDKVVSTDGHLVWGQPNILWASLTMALLTVPVVIVTVEETLRAIPNEYRAASLALGATKWQTIRKIILPNAVPGILTGTILAIGRGAGEVAPILFTGVAYFLPHLPSKLSDQFMNLGYHVYILSTQSTDVEATKGLQYATVLVLLMVTFSLNFIAVIVRYFMRKKAIQ